MRRNGLLSGSADGEGSNIGSNGRNCSEVCGRSLPCQGKIRHFIRKCFRDILPVKDALVRRHLANDVLCPLCKEDRESVVHLFVRCPFAQVVWRLSPLGVNMSTVLGEDNMLERW